MSFALARRCGRIKSLGERGKGGCSVLGCRKLFSTFSDDDTNQTMKNRKGIVVTPTMNADTYGKHSIHQYDAHVGCEDYLQGAIERLQRRASFEDQFCDHDDHGRRRRHVVDLGSADGTNSMRTLRRAVQMLHHDDNDKLPLHITLEEHPASNQDLLRDNLQQNQDWFQDNNITYSVMMKSFYEPLFAKESVDLLLCYICLHWLDTTSTTSVVGQNSVSDWKHWEHENKHTSKQPLLSSKFVFMNEATVPNDLKAKWNEKLSTLHLAKFLALRARELRPGAEGILMMVGQPSEYVCPPPADNSSSSKDNSNPSPSPLTLAMQTCAQRGELRETILQQTLVPYYTRSLDDLKKAFEVAATIHVCDLVADDEEAASLEEETSGNFPGALLSLVDAKAYNVNVGKGSIDSAFDMFWSIHSGAVSGTGATEEELESVKRETRHQFHLLYDPQKGVNVSYLACLIRRRTRKAWS